MGKPKIRFEGYSEDWEQCKSGEIAPLRGGFAFKSNEYCSEGIPIVRISNILSDGSVGEDYAYYCEQASDEIYTLYDGAVVLAMSGATTGKVSVLRAEKGQKYYQNQRVGYFIPTDICDYSFVKTIMRSHLFTDQLSAVLVAGAQPNVSSKEIDGFEFLIPQSKEEQKKIGAYFTNLDHLITLHQRKCDETKTLKKYMLQKMFPQNGEKVPEIRFDGFTEDWEQRKLGELGTVQTCKRIFKEQTSEQGDIPFFKNGTIGLEPDSYISREVYEEFRRLYPYPEVGDTLISVVGSIGRTAEYTGKDEYFQDSNVVWLKTNGSINKKFLKISYQVIKWLIEGSTVKHLYNDNILRSEIVMPVSQIEQAKIAEFFEELDHLITLHQRKCNELKEIKKYMLQNMFV